MVTGYNERRREFAKVSIRNFKQQTYKNKHLIILNQSKNKLIKNEEKNVLEIYIDNTNKTLGEIRNISLQFVPPNAIWTTWDDDDWRHPTYIHHMTNEMRKRKVDFLMFTNRFEYNLNNKFAFKMSLQTGFMTFFSRYNPNIRYEHKSTSEDVKVKKYAIDKLNTSIYHNDAKMYIRMIHDDNTSVFVKSDKNDIKNTKTNRMYFENELNNNEKRFVDNIIFKYYKQCMKSLKN
tara:strand:+ start:2869 stop:3570 length:702 start_codon:yes stop_codon:yes gene_type:complete